MAFVKVPKWTFTLNLLDISVWSGVGWEVWWESGDWEGSSLVCTQSFPGEQNYDAINN